MIKLIEKTAYALIVISFLSCNNDKADPYDFISKEVLADFNARYPSAVVETVAGSYGDVVFTYNNNGCLSKCRYYDSKFAINIRTFNTDNLAVDLPETIYNSFITNAGKFSDFSSQSDYCEEIILEGIDNTFFVISCSFQDGSGFIVLNHRGIVLVKNSGYLVRPDISLCSTKDLFNQYLSSLSQVRKNNPNGLFEAVIRHYGKYHYYITEEGVITSEVI